MIITITEKKFTEEDGSFHFKKHKIYLYKEDFLLCRNPWWYDCLCFKPQRREVISERHQKDFKKEYGTEKVTTEEALPIYLVLRILILMTFLYY
jgi:hypothetical protein